MLVTVEDPDAFSPLYDWLLRDEMLRGTVVRPAPVSPADQEMGVVADTVEIVAAHGELLTAVATTVGVWLGTRVRRTRIRIKEGDREVEIDTGTLKDPHEIALRILSHLRDD
ncbi:effector-associated constant component EACC1 [Asanoa iriomotensis]|uniref:Uncharacterized protein n=1 Tax=Asanoa iriomotensis TaxID=234613 RepID=A0ABQ4BWJ9_9ACTN|nr:hypothetical protein [Asanoa iriomotensis]GIF54897.1 hypothetical protein Air01nite_09920 [Asanoa iriomotensis]